MIVGVFCSSPTPPSINRHMIELVSHYLVYTYFPEYATQQAGSENRGGESKGTWGFENHQKSQIVESPIVGPYLNLKFEI